jgi:hypothetical protein
MQWAANMGSTQTRQIGFKIFIVRMKPTKKDAWKIFQFPTHYAFFPKRAELFVAAGFLEHLAEIAVLSARGFEIKHQVFDAKAQVIEAFLQAADGLAKSFVALPRFDGQLLEFSALCGGKGADLTHQLGQLGLELVLVH